MCALFDNDAKLKCHNLVAICNSGESMSYHESSGAFGDILNRSLNFNFSSCIKSRCGFIEAHNWTLFIKCSGNGDSLFLTSREFKSSFAHIFPISLVSFHDKIVDLCSFGKWNKSFNKFIFLAILKNQISNFGVCNATICNIIHNCIIKKTAVLWYNSYLLSNVRCATL